MAYTTLAIQNSYCNLPLNWTADIFNIINILATSIDDSNYNDGNEYNTCYSSGTTH